MIRKLSNEDKLGNGHISILYPGRKLGRSDTGIGSIGRIDQANIGAGTTIKMHPHINDEILSYFRTGKIRHTDSADTSKLIGRNTLMLMKAGKVFYHEEEVLERLEGLQIFIRPKRKDDSPQVLFHELEHTDSWDAWRQLASPVKEDALFQFSSETWIFDLTADTLTNFSLPEFPKKRLTALLYVFQGNIALTGNASIHEKIILKKGESVILKEDEIPLFKEINISSEAKTQLVLFLTDEDADFFDGGMYSGNKSQ